MPEASAPQRARPETHEPKREPEGRAARIPLGVQRLKLTSSSRLGYVRRWINDDGIRVAAAQKGGYDFVRREGSAAQSTDPGDYVSQVVGRMESGTPLRAFLMEIREEWFLEDQAAKQLEVDKREQQIKRGELEGKPGVDGVYLPKGRPIKVKTGSGW